MTGGTPYLATDTRGAGRALPEDPRGSREVARSRTAARSTPSCTALPAGRVRAAGRWRSRCASPAFAPALTMRIADPHVLWLLLAVPAAVLAYASAFAAAAPARRASATGR